MSLRSTSRNLVDFRLVLENLEKNRHQYNQVSFAQLRRIMRRRIAELASKLRRESSEPDNHRAA